MIKFVQERQAVACSRNAGTAELDKRREKAAAQAFAFEASQAEGDQTTSRHLQAQLGTLMARRPHAKFE